RRPRDNEREILSEGELTLTDGLVGDCWKARGSAKTADGGPHPDMQINIINSRLLALVAQHPDRWPLAGDQLVIDLDLSAGHLPPGTQLAIGSAVIEVTHLPHLGCRKFAARFGPDAVKFVNSPVGKELHLRGINAKVVRPGIIRAGDMVRKMKR